MTPPLNPSRRRWPERRLSSGRPRNSAARCARARSGSRSRTASLFTIGVGVLLGTIYLFTARVRSRTKSTTSSASSWMRSRTNTIAKVSTGVTAELTRLDETWGRAGAIYMLVDQQPRRSSPATSMRGRSQGVPRETWLEFTVEIGRESGTEQLPCARASSRCRKAFCSSAPMSRSGCASSRRFRHGDALGHRDAPRVLGAFMGFWLEPAAARARARRVRASASAFSRATCRDGCRFRARAMNSTALATAVNRVLDAAGRADRACCARRSRAPRTICAVRLFRLRARLEELLRARDAERHREIRARRARPRAAGHRLASAHARGAAADCAG